MPEEQLSECCLVFSFFDLTRFSEAAQLTWRSPIYSFFKSNVSVRYEGTQMYHFFPCSARRCKSETGGCRRFQDKGDRSSTSNLKAHAIGCFGEEAIKLAITAKEGEACSGNIFTAFARQGQKPVTYTHRGHTNTEVRVLMAIESEGFTSRDRRWEGTEVAEHREMYS